MENVSDIYISLCVGMVSLVIPINTFNRHTIHDMKPLSALRLLVKLWCCVIVDWTWYCIKKTIEVLANRDAKWHPCEITVIVFGESELRPMSALNRRQNICNTMSHKIMFYPLIYWDLNKMTDIVQKIFQTHFLQWKSWYFNHDFTYMWCQWSNCQ